MMLERGKDTDGYRFYSDSNGLTGWIRSDLPENFFAEFMRDPDGWMDRVSADLLKDGPKTKVVQQVFEDGIGIRLKAITKRFHYGFGLRRLGFFFFPSPATRCLKGALLLKSKGILTAEPLAALEYRDWKGLGTSYYVSEEVPDSCSLHFFWQSILPALPAKRRLAARRSILRDLARLLSKLHSMGIYHRDLKTSNILLQKWDGEERRVFLVDLDRIAERRSLPLSKKIKNLLQLGRRPLKDKIYLFMRYAETVYGSKKESKALVRNLLSMSQKDHLRRQAQRRLVKG